MPTLVVPTHSTMLFLRALQHPRVSVRENIGSNLVESRVSGASLLAQMVKNLPAVWETQVRSLVLLYFPLLGNSILLCKNPLHPCEMDLTN